MGLVAAEAAGAAADSAVVAGDHRMGPAVAARQAEEDRMVVVDLQAADLRVVVVRRLAGLRAAVVVHTDTKAVWAHRVDETRCLEHIKSVDRRGHTLGAKARVVPMGKKPKAEALGYLA
jgi:hypothetical protein